MKKTYVEMFTYKKGLFGLKDNLFDNIESINSLLNDIINILKELSKLSDKGFINEPNIDMPLLRLLFSEYNIDKTDKEKEEDKEGSNTNISYSIQINIMYFNMILLLLLELIIKMEKAIVNETNDDLKIDLKTVHKSLRRMIHPVLRDKISNKGLSIILNTIVGFDSEYELKSSLNKENDILSIQLSGKSGALIKVPINSQEPVRPEEINNIFKGGEKRLMTVCCNSLDKVIKNIRLSLYKENDALLEKILLKLSSMELEYEFIENYKVFKLPRSEVESLIKYNKKDIENIDSNHVNTFIKYDSNDLIKDSDNLCNKNHTDSLYKIILLINDICNKEMSDKIQSSILKSSNKPQSRITYKYKDLDSNKEIVLSISIKRYLYICMHESSADLSILNDFDIFKEKLDIINRSFVTLGKPLLFEWCKSNVHIRDTILIAPMGAKSLASVGNIYGDDYKKIDIGSYRGNMRLLLKENKDLFDTYAVRDSLITLKHACSMEEFNFTVGKIGVPLTLSNIGKSYVLKEWFKKNYKGYQVRDDMMMGNIASFLTPKGARAIDISNFIVPFIAGYRGGRNESFMYGVDEINDKKRSWIDYDLTSCYTTVMSILGHPDYEKAARLYNKTVLKMSERDLLLNYIILDVDFKFPKDTKYPSIPARVDDDVDIYPLEGRSTITGCEYLVAKSMGCRLSVRSGVLIPFVKNDDSKTLNNLKRINELEEEIRKVREKNPDDFKNDVRYIEAKYDLDICKKENGSKKNNFDYLSPYREIIKDLQSKRRQYPKKTFYNYMYKEIGNSIYGQIAMGISGRKTFDVKTKSFVKIVGGVLSNPIMSSYITGFTRALIGECLFHISQMKGRVVSVTTDGFITDVIDLENKILNHKNINCLNLYKEIRRFLTTFEDTNTDFDDRALEVKNVEDLGIITWKTRGQLGFTDGGITAATGFQTRDLDKSFLTSEISRVVKTNSIKNIEYIQKGLRGANDIYKHGGHVVVKYSDKSYSFEYDNKRRIIENEGCILDSVPWHSISEYGKIRLLKTTITKPVFSKGYIESQSKSYKSYIETSVRGFIKACLSNNENLRFGIPFNSFKNYKSIIDFIHGFEPAKEVKMSISSISKLKNRNVISRTVPRTPENELFILYVKEHFKDFEVDRFFKELSDEVIRAKKSSKQSL